MKLSLEEARDYLTQRAGETLEDYHEDSPDASAEENMASAEKRFNEARAVLGLPPLTDPDQSVSEGIARRTFTVSLKVDYVDSEDFVFTYSVESAMAQFREDVTNLVLREDWDTFAASVDVEASEDAGS